jgi:glutathione peroxidase
MIERHTCMPVGNAGANFQLFDKVDVNGDAASDVWKHLKKEQGGFLTADIKW